MASTLFNIRGVDATARASTQPASDGADSAVRHLSDAMNRDSEYLDLYYLLNVKQSKLLRMAS